MKTLQDNPETPEESPLKMEFTPDGMRISVFDRNHKPIFEPDTAQFTAYGAWIFSTLAWEIARYTNTFSIELEGHTEQGRPPRTIDNDDWDLSTLRANAARRKLLTNDVLSSQIRKVAGFADTQPLENVNPRDESNRRVGVLLKLKQGSRF